MPRQKSLSPEIIDLAIAGVDARIRELEEQKQLLLRQRSGSTASYTAQTSTSASGKRGRKKGSRLSEEARRILSQKAKERWAKRKGTKLGKKANAAASTKASKA